MTTIDLPVTRQGPTRVEVFLNHPGIATINAAFVLWDMIRFWIYRHPKISRISAALAFIALVELMGAQAAFASAPSEITGPGLTMGGLKDSQGIPIYQYVELPLDRGDVWTFEKTLISYPIDLVWAGHIFYINLVIAVVTYILSFEWVSILATPIASMADSLQLLMSEIKWIPFALLITAFVTGIAMLKGKTSSALIEFTLAIVLALLATGVLANPVATLTGPTGAITQAQDWGGKLAISITVPKDEQPQDGSKFDAKTVLTDSVSSSLVDMFIRQPTQMIAFGKTLDAKCAEKFNTEMKKKNPFNGGNSVRDSVGDCDKEAKDYVQNPNFNQILSTYTISSGSLVLFIFMIVLCCFFVFTVLSAIWSAFKLMIQTLQGILPYIARTGFWYGLAGIASSVLLMVFAMILLAGYLRLTVLVLQSTAALGMTLQMSIINMMLTAGLVILFIMRRKAKKAGETLGDMLNKIGKSGTRKEPSRPVTEFAKAVAPVVSPSSVMPSETKRRRPQPKFSPMSPHPSITWWTLARQCRQHGPNEHPAQLQLSRQAEQRKPSLRALTAQGSRTRDQEPRQDRPALPARQRRCPVWDLQPPPRQRPQRMLNVPRRFPRDCRWPPWQQTSFPVEAPSSRASKLAPRWAQLQPQRNLKPTLRKQSSHASASTTQARDLWRSRWRAKSFTPHRSEPKNQLKL